MKSNIIKFFIFAAIIGAIIFLEKNKPVSMIPPTSNGSTVEVGSVAPEITNPSGFLNTDNKPITIGEFKNKKVVLVDIMTYSCINCQRTFPYLNDWYAKYKDKGLVIIGIHTPEFEFEKNIDNVRSALARFNIQFPVVLDNGYGTWNAFNNRYWPRKYLIDKDGKIAFDHIGEGNYLETENKIRELLGLPALTASDTLSEREVTTPTQSPETYLGSNRREYFAGNFTYDERTARISSVPKNSFALFGTFSDEKENIVTTDSPSSLVYHFDAGKVFLVAGADQDITAKVYLDGVLISDSYAGSDVVHGMLTIREHRLYNLVDLQNKPGVHTLEIQFEKGGVSLFAFTFGA